LFLNDADAWKSRDRARLREPISKEILARTEIPQGLTFFVDETTRVTSAKEADLDAAGSSSYCEQNRQRLMERQLGAMKPRSALFHVYEQNAGGKDVRKPQHLLGTIVTQSNFIMSWFGDAAVHFKHEPYTSDALKAQLLKAPKGGPSSLSLLKPKVSEPLADDGSIKEKQIPKNDKSTEDDDSGDDLPTSAQPTGANPKLSPIIKAHRKADHDTEAFREPEPFTSGQPNVLSTSSERT